MSLDKIKHDDFFLISPTNTVMHENRDLRFLIFMPYSIHIQLYKYIYRYMYNNNNTCVMAAFFFYTLEPI